MAAPKKMRIAMPNDEKSRTCTRAASYEKRDIDMRLVTWISVTVVVAIVLGWAVARFFLDSRQQALLQEPDLGVLTNLRSRDVPVLQQHPARDYQQLQSEDTKRLRSYGWVNKSEGFVHIPIEEAKKKLLRQESQGGNSHDAQKQQHKQ